MSCPPPLSSLEDGRWDWTFQGSHHGLTFSVSSPPPGAHPESPQQNKRYSDHSGNYKGFKRQEPEAETKYVFIITPPCENSILPTEWKSENPRKAECLKNWSGHLDLNVRIPSYPSLFLQCFLHWAWACFQNDLLLWWCMKMLSK